MLVIKSFFSGWGKTLALPSLVFLRWFLNLAFAVILVAPIMELLAIDLDHSVLSDDLLDRMDILYPGEFANRFHGELEGIKAYRLGFLLAFGLFNLYLSGGIIAALHAENRLSWRQFFNRCGQHFFPLILTVLLGLGFFFAAVVIPFAVVTAIYDSISSSLSPQWALSFYWLGTGATFLFLGSFAWRVYDMARILVCSETSQRNVFSQFSRALSFTWRFHYATFFLWALFALTHIGLFALYFWLKPYLPLQSSLGMWAELGAGQLLLLGRIAVGIASLAGLLTFYNAKLIPQPTNGTDQGSVQPADQSETSVFQEQQHQSSDEKEPSSSDGVEPEPDKSD